MAALYLCHCCYYTNMHCYKLYVFVFIENVFIKVSREQVLHDMFVLNFNI